MLSSFVNFLMATASMIPFFGPPIVPVLQVVPQTQTFGCTNPVIRREWRALSKFERSEWIRGIKCLAKLPHNPSVIATQFVKHNPSLNTSSSYYDDIVFTHMDLGHVIHATGRFYPWHRTFIHTVETAMKRHCKYEGVMPYWNWTIDAANFYSSPMFADPDPESGLGGWGNPDTDARVLDGAFAEFELSYPYPHTLTRNFTLRPFLDYPDADLWHIVMDRMANLSFTPEVIEDTINGWTGDYRGFQFAMEAIQAAHFSVHTIMGGDMSALCSKEYPLTSACNANRLFTSSVPDPMFFLHHTMVDKIWHDWQMKHPDNLNAFSGGSRQAEGFIEYDKYPIGIPPNLKLKITLIKHFLDSQQRCVQIGHGTYLLIETAYERLSRVAALVIAVGASLYIKKSVNLPFPKLSQLLVDAIITGLGSLHELETRYIDGRVQRVYKQLWPSLRTFWLWAAAQHAPLTYAVFEDRRMTYVQTFERSVRMAGIYRDVYGVRKDPERAELLESVAAKLKAEARCNGILVFAVEEGKGNWSGMESWEAVLAAYDGDTRSIVTGEGEAEILPEDNAMIMFTSGTTGMPKGVLSTQRQYLTNLLNHLIWSVEYQTVVSRYRAVLRRGGNILPKQDSETQKGSLVPVPLFHVTGSTSRMMMATLAGMKLVLMRKWVPEEGARLIKAENVSIVGGVPSMIMDLAETSLAKSSSSIEAFGFGGAPPSEFLAERITKLFPDVVLSSGGEDYLACPLSTGLAMPVNDVMIVREDVAVPPGELGEVWIKGVNVMKEYWRDPAYMRIAATDKASTVCEEQHAITKDGWFKSGDLGYLDTGGFLYIKDRIKDVIIRDGENIDSTTVENALYADARVMEAAAVAVPHIRLGEVVAAVVAVKPAFKGQVTEAALISLAAKRSCVNPPARKEWRTLSKYEKAEFIHSVKPPVVFKSDRSPELNAVLQCLASTPHNTSVIATQNQTQYNPPLNVSGSYYDDISYTHMDLSNLVHSTGLFLPWHRAYVKAFETAIQTHCGYEGMLPYWDWTLDAHDFYNSPVFDSDPQSGLGGWGNPEHDMRVENGGFSVSSGFKLSYPYPHTLRRNFTLQPEILEERRANINPEKMANVSFAPGEVQKLTNGFVGDYRAFQIYFEAIQGAHYAVHSIMGA
ncbi:hypothetical protein DXG01_010467 [Tephrocybe rancida]|nr:hypothetical protein DXG01_010467 [Tephrocybe rancida]